MGKPNFENEEEYRKFCADIGVPFNIMEEGLFHAKRYGYVPKNKIEIVEDFYAEIAMRKKHDGTVDPTELWELAILQDEVIRDFKLKEKNK